MAARTGGGLDEQEEFQYTRMTPLEVDAQLQAAELIFRSLLEGKRLGVHPAEDIEEWHQDVLGEAWVQQNRRQRKEIMRQMRASGENTPEWMESLENMGDIAWEVFETGKCGETMRKPRDIDRQEIIEQFKELFPKVRDSYFARCGAGEHLYGLRACIAIFRLFIQDAEVLDATASCLQWIIHDHEYNRDGLAELSLPMPPAERMMDSPERGWAFLRAAFDAFMVQGGSEPFSWRPSDLSRSDLDPEDEDCFSDDESATAAAAVDTTPRPATAIKIAGCIVGVRNAPACRVQLKLLGEPLPENACTERKELQEMVPQVYRKAEDLHRENPSAVLTELMEMLLTCGPRATQQRRR